MMTIVLSMVVPVCSTRIGAASSGRSRLCIHRQLRQGLEVKALPPGHVWVLEGLLGGQSRLDSIFGCAESDKEPIPLRVDLLTGARHDCTAEDLPVFGKEF